MVAGGAAVLLLLYVLIKFSGCVGDKILAHPIKMCGERLMKADSPKDERGQHRSVAAIDTAYPAYSMQQHTKLNLLYHET